jgi:acetyltransferase-like isoleucine patch superfamily enzyme
VPLTRFPTPWKIPLEGQRLNGKTDPVRLDERLQRHSIGQPVTIGNDVWIGANVTIL